MKMQNTLNQHQLFTASQNANIRRKLVEIMHDQIRLFELTDLFITVFNSIILMHFISVALIIGIGSIDLLMVCTRSMFALTYDST